MPDPVTVALASASISLVTSLGTFIGLSLVPCPLLQTTRQRYNSGNNSLCRAVGILANSDPDKWEVIQFTERLEE